MKEWNHYRPALFDSCRYCFIETFLPGNCFLWVRDCLLYLYRLCFLASIESSTYFANIFKFWYKWWSVLLGINLSCLVNLHVLFKDFHCLVVPVISCRLSIVNNKFYLITMIMMKLMCWFTILISDFHIKLFPMMLWTAFLNSDLKFPSLVNSIGKRWIIECRLLWFVGFGFNQNFKIQLCIRCLFINILIIVQ